jgi:hypothetical protein
MYDWLPGLCRELRGNLVLIYWILIIPLTTFLCILEMFKVHDQNPNIPNVVKRAVTSIILLISFNECLHIISFVGDGIIERIGGMNNIRLVLQEMWKVLKKTEVSWIHYKEMVIFFISLLAYIAAYLGAFIADALVHFCWSILYVVSPLMILSYIPEGTSGTCKNLYRSLCTVMCWKILWAILGALLLKLSTSAPLQDGNDYNAILIVVMNLFIGASMLFVPFATKSIISDGLSNFASGLAAVPAMATQRVLVNAVKHVTKRGAVKTWRGMGHGARFAGEKMGLVAPRSPSTDRATGGKWNDQSRTPNTNTSSANNGRNQTQYKPRDK